MGLWPGRDLSWAPTWLVFSSSQTISVSEGINKILRQERMFGVADSGGDG